MRCLLISALLVSATYGWVEWKDLRGRTCGPPSSCYRTILTLPCCLLQVGKSRLPLTLKEAQADGWKQVGRTSAIKISWFMKDSDPRLLVAFDAHKNIAGLSFNQLQSQVNDAYIGVYLNSGLFDEMVWGGKPYYSATMLFTPTSVLRSGGRKKLTTDEKAMGLYVKRGREYVQTNRDGCDHEDTGAVEQGCQRSYGLVFSDLGDNSSCNSLSPFYTLWDTEYTGNLIGFGLLSFGYDPLPNSNIVDEYTLKALFPRSPACLTTASREVLTALDVWFAPDVSRQSSCSSGNWGDTHCDRRIRTMYNAL